MKVKTPSSHGASIPSCRPSWKGQAVSESAIKNALHPDAIKATDRRAKFVGIEAYKAEGGAVTRDLFSDEVFLASPALLDRLFAEKLESARADLVETQGWANATRQCAVGCRGGDALCGQSTCIGYAPFDHRHHVGGRSWHS